MYAVQHQGQVEHQRHQINSRVVKVVIAGGILITGLCLAFYFFGHEQSLLPSRQLTDEQSTLLQASPGDPPNDPKPVSVLEEKPAISTIRATLIKHKVPLIIGASLAVALLIGGIAAAVLYQQKLDPELQAESATADALIRDKIQAALEKAREVGKPPSQGDAVRVERVDPSSPSFYGYLIFGFGGFMALFYFVTLIVVNFFIKEKTT